MARTNINSVPFIGQGSADSYESMDLSGGTATDAVNGNSTANNGSLYLFVTTSAADATFTIRKPEEAAGQVENLANGAIRWLGPFRTDIYGDHVEWTGLATTKVLPVQMVELT